MVFMKTTYDLTIRAFPVKIKDERTGEVLNDVIVLDKQRLQAANLVDQSSKEIIQRIYRKNGYKVLDIGKPDKLNVEFRLDNMYTELTTREEIPMDQLWYVAGGDSIGEGRKSAVV